MIRRLNVEVDPLPFRMPLRIAGRIFTGMPCVRVRIEEKGAMGRGEAGGVFYLGDDIDHMIAEIGRVRSEVVAGADRAELRGLLPPGGARNALDAALWELESHQTGRPIWALAGLAPPQPLITTFTLGADPVAQMLSALDGYAGARAVKLKLDGDVDADVARLRATRARRPDVWLMVDANQGYSVDLLDRLLPVLVETNVALVEQPVRRGDEATLLGLKSPIPLAADESVLALEDLPLLVGVFEVANIKLDKCGGLTEALLMEREARRLGLHVMVGNMGGSSLAAAPAWLLGQRCDFVDLDGPAFLAHDVGGGAAYHDGEIGFADGFWGAD